MTSDDGQVDDQVGYISVSSERLPTGGYACAVSTGPDRQQVLDPEHAVAYAVEVLRAAEVAVYEAAVLAQLASVGEGDEGRAAAHQVAAQVILGMRAGRQAMPSEGMPLRLLPIVSTATREGLLHVAVDGEVVAQWSVDDAREHAVAVLRTVLVAPLDGLYAAVLVDTIGLDEGTAAAMVDRLDEHRAD